MSHFGNAPLSSGAGAEVRRVMGITVFSGMIGVTLFGLFTVRKLFSRRRDRVPTAALTVMH